MVAAVVYVIAKIYEEYAPWVGYVRATAEASLVGGLADWFAVTALFRQPLGLPIPHTAIVKRQKDRIARVLGRTGINVMTRLMGLMLAAMAVELLADGLIKLFPVLASTLSR